jgi:hypothetical protein
MITLDAFRRCAADEARRRSPTSTSTAAIWARSLLNRIRPITGHVLD